MSITQEIDVFSAASAELAVIAEAEAIVTASLSREDTAAYPIRFMDVTLRDGLQQDDIKKGEVGASGKPEGLSVEERLGILDQLIDAGIEEIEVGHFGNPEDRPFGRALVQHVNAKIASGDERYKRAKFQVLFGAQIEGIREGISVLEGLDKDQVIVHVYNRISPGLRDLASFQPNTAEKSAADLCAAVDIALQAGFFHYSVSGEGAVDHTQGPEVVADYHNTITRYLFEHGARTVNVNLANTFGSSAYGLWDQDGLRAFNQSVKAVATEFTDKTVTTSVHAHNDYGSAVDFSIQAIAAGFDKVEGAMIGMGERVGNTAIVDVLVRLAEMAMVDYENIERHIIEGPVQEDIFSLRALKRSLFAHRFVESHTVAAFENMYQAARSIGVISETERFGETSLGRERSYDAGSGPHCEANAKYVASPMRYRLLETYGRIASIHSMFGHPVANAIVAIDTDMMKAITVDNHAGGGNTRKVQEGRIRRASQDEVDAHIAVVHGRQAIVRALISRDVQFLKP